MKILSMKVIAAWLAVLLLTVQCPALAEQAPVQSPEPGAVFSLGEGSHVLDAAALAAAAQVVVSPGAVAVIDFANQKDLDLTGAFVNQGAVYFGSSSALVTDVSLSAASILNEAGATISSLLPAGLPGFASAVASLSFTLSAVGDLVNRGSIVSSGNLNLTAGGALVNEGLVSARQSVNIAALAGTLTNSGTIAALAGNLNISALLPQFEAGSIARSLAVNNQSGLLQAINGALEIAGPQAASSLDIAVTGGSLAAREINLRAGAGDIVVRVDEISGTLSTAAGFAQVGVSAPMLTLGTVKIDGDPVFFNDAGGITITGPVDVQEALRIIARDDIVFDGAPVSITARDAGGVGQEISLIAGADITTGTDPTLTIPPLTSTATSDVTVAGPSANGGRITASSTTPAFSINSFAACSGCPGGSIVLAAFRGQSSGSGGSIDLPLASINSSGNGAGAAGNVTAIAGASSGTGVSLFRITASNASGGGGNVGIFSAQPTTSDGLDIVFQTDGTISSANFLVPSSGAAAEGAITLDQGISARGNILAVTNGSFALTDLNASLSTANSDSGPGGNINVLAGGDINLGNEARTRGTDADSGHVLAAAGVTSSFAAGEVSVTGFSGTGGRIASGFIDTRPGFDLGPGGAGGDITLIAFRGTSGTSGTIANAAGSTAGGFSRGGSQLVVGGAETGTALQFDTIATGMDTGGTPGSLTLAAAQPGLSGGNPLVVDMSTGAVTSGAFTFSENSLAAGEIVTGLIVSNGGEVKVLTGGNYTMAGSFIGTGPASGDAGNLTIRAGGTLSLGASTLIAALGGAGGADGQVNLTAGTTFVKTLDMRGGEFNLTGDTIDLPDFITASGVITITVTDGGSLINNDRSIATTVISDTSILIQADNPGGDDEMTLSGTGNFTPGSNQFVEITAPTRLHFADGMDWVLINGSAVVLTPELRGADNGSANLQTLDADGCICVQEETGSTIRFRSEDGSSPTTIMLNAPSAAISVEGAGEEMILDAGVTLSSSGTWDIGVNEDAVLRLDGLIQSSAQSIDIRNDSDGMGLRGTGALTPGGGNPVNIISLGNLVLFDGLDITVTSGGLVVDGTTILGPDGGLARITAPGTIELGSCDCLRVAPLTAGQQTTIELDTGALNIIADGFTLDQGAMLTTPGDLFAQVSGAGQFVNNGILRTTSSNNAIISSQSGDALEIAGTGEFRLDAAIPPFLVFMSNSEISFQGANSVRTANALTLAPVFIGAPQISGIAGGGGLTTDGGSISISNTDGSDAIEFNGGTLNFNGGPLYVQNNTVSLRSATTLASNNLIGIYLPDTMGPAVFSNEGTLRSTAAGTNIYIIGDSGYAIAGDGAINSSGGSIGLTAGETVTVGTGAAMTQDFSGSGAVYFVASVVELNDALLRSATATTFGFTTGTGQDLTIAVAGASTVDTSQGFVYMQPGTVTQSIFLDAGAPGAELTLNTHSAFGVGLRTAPPGASNLDPSLVLRSDGRITCQGNCNGFPLLAAPALAADLLSLSVAGGKPAVSAASLLSGISAGLAVVSTVTGLDSLPSSTRELAVSARQPRSRSGQAARSPVVRAADDIDDQESARLTALGVRIGNGPYGRNLALEGGSVLFAPVEAVTVDAGSAELAIEAGAAVFVCRRDDALAVYNLHDRHRDGVRALIGTASIVVRPGQCLIVSADERAAPSAGWRLPLRRLQVLESRAGLSLALAEFSLASAMLRIPQLVDLFRSTARDDRRLSASLIKMAAIQHQLGAGHGPFRER